MQLILIGEGQDNPYKAVAICTEISVKQSDNVRGREKARVGTFWSGGKEATLGTRLGQT